MINNIDFSNFSGFFKTGIPDIVLVPSIALCICVILFALLSTCIKRKKAIILYSLFAEYIFVVLCSTVICRNQVDYARIEAMPFWDYFAIANKTPGVSVWDIILNVILFLPFGFLLSAIKPDWKWWKITLFGFAFSFCIESMQFIFSKGIAQTDDLMHNSIGALLGFALFQSVNLFLKTKRCSLN